MRKRLEICLVLIAVSLPSLLQAQFTEPAGFDPNVLDVPFDDYVPFLIVIALIYGIWIIRKTRKAGMAMHQKQLANNKIENF